MGKIIGGGVPVAAYGGVRRVDESRRAARSRLPGGYPCRQSPGNARRHRNFAQGIATAGLVRRIKALNQKLGAGLRKAP